MNNIDNNLYSITDEQLQIAHQIAKILVKEQKRIKPDETGKGIISELSKLVTYLDYKIKKNINLPQKERQPTKFFAYLEELAKNSETIGHSGKTVNYYEAINETCKQYLKAYVKKPQVIIQILGWTQRLMHYYKNFDISDLDISEAPKFVKPEVEKPEVEETSQTSKAPQKVQSPKPRSPQPVELTQTDNSQLLKRPTPTKAPKPVESSPKLETPKVPEPPNPFKRPSQRK